MSCFNDIYENLSEIYESNLLEERQADIDAFNDKFGENVYDKFTKLKGRLKNNNISVDIVYHTKNTSVEDMNNLLNDAENRVVKDTSGKTKFNRVKVAENENYTVWDVKDWETAMNMGEGTNWCITGRYDTEEVKPSQAEKYFTDYLKTPYSMYLFVIPKDGDYNKKYCICPYQDEDKQDVWNNKDDVVSVIKGIPEIDYKGFVFSDSPLTFFKNWDIQPEEETITVEFTPTKLSYILAEANPKIRQNFLEKVLRGETEDFYDPDFGRQEFERDTHFDDIYSYNIKYLNDYIIKNGGTEINTEEDFREAVENDENLEQVVYRALNEANAEGSFQECCDDLIYYIKDILPYKVKIQPDYSKIEIIVDVQSLIDNIDKVDITDDWDKTFETLQDSIAYTISHADQTFSEPYYGWVGFDTDVFNGVLLENW